MKFRIRIAVSEDKNKIEPLQAEIARLHYVGRPDLMKDSPRFFADEEFLKRLNDPKHTVLIAESEQGQVIGYAFAWLIEFRNHPVYKDFDCFYIDDICVLQSHQRQGVGKALFAECKSSAEKMGCKIMDLSVWSFNRDAIAFYEVCGMTERTRRMELCL